MPAGVGSVDNRENSFAAGQMNDRHAKSVAPRRPYRTRVNQRAGRAHRSNIPEAGIGLVLVFVVRSKLQFVAVTAKPDIVRQVEIDRHINLMSTQRTSKFVVLCRWLLLGNALPQRQGSLRARAGNDITEATNQWPKTQEARHA